MHKTFDCEPSKKKLIREAPDFPCGIVDDITTLLKVKRGFATLIDALSEHYIDQEIEAPGTWRRADSSAPPLRIV